MSSLLCFSFFFFFNDTATTEIYTLSLHDALPISFVRDAAAVSVAAARFGPGPLAKSAYVLASGDRKSTRLNSSHRCISYAVFCLKKKKNKPKLQSRHSQTRNRLTRSLQLTRKYQA